MIESTDPLFDPLFLCSEWYFSNKCFVPKSLFDNFPMPRNNIARGIGNEDWTWSGTTIAAGIDHKIVPYTACFYRHKPQEDSLGLVPGMIHGPSELYMPTFVQRSSEMKATKEIGSAAYNVNSSIKVSNYPNELAPHPWVWDEVRRQSIFEPLLSDLFNLDEASSRIQTPNLHFNVAQAYQEICRNLNDDAKLFMFFTSKNLQGSDFLLEKVVSDARNYLCATSDIVVFIDDEDQMFDENYFFHRYRCKIVSIYRLRSYYKLEDWYFSRFLMRILIQIKSIQIVDFCSDVFGKMFALFERAICSLHKNIHFVYPNLQFDFASSFGLRLKHNLERYFSHNGFFPLAHTFAATPTDQSVWWSNILTPIPEEIRQEWSTILRQRFDHVSGRRVERLKRINFAFIFEYNNRLITSPIYKEEKSSKSYHIRDLFEEAGLVVTGNAWAGKDIYSECLQVLLDNPKVLCVVPQILAYWSRTDRVLINWIDYHGIRNHLASLIDLCILKRLDLPFFAVYRRGTNLDDAIGRQISVSAQPITIDVILTILDNTNELEIIPLERSLCASKQREDLGQFTNLIIEKAKYVKE